MNPQIQELWRECVLKHAKNPMNWQMAADEFAELIVEKCADLCDRFQARDVGMQPAECASAIRNMFGVE